MAGRLSLVMIRRRSLRVIAIIWTIGMVVLHYVIVLMLIHCRVLFRPAVQLLGLVADLLGHSKGVQVQRGAGQEEGLPQQWHKHGHIVVTQWRLHLARAVVVGVVWLRRQSGRPVGIDGLSVVGDNIWQRW